MRYSIATLLALLSATTIALPLNINLGAYSPALVVGDGEISFGGTETAATTLATLSEGATTTAKESTPNGVTINPAISASPSPSPSPSPSLAAGVLGIGKSSIGPRADTTRVEERRDEIEQRDIAGFNAALNFAAGGLANGPTVELGTGEGGSGVGITVKPATAAKAARERDVEEGEERRDLPTVTLMRVRSLGGEAGEYFYYFPFLACLHLILMQNGLRLILIQFRRSEEKGSERSNRKRCSADRERES